MTQTSFQQLRAKYVNAAMKRASQRTDLFLMIETATSAALVRKAAKQYFDECLKFDRLLEGFIARLDQASVPSAPPQPRPRVRARAKAARRS